MEHAMKLAGKTFGVVAVMVIMLSASRGVLRAAEMSMGPSKLLQVSGKIVSIDLVRRELMVEEKQLGIFPRGQTKSFVWNAETAIHGPEDSQRLTPKQLVPGSLITLDYHVENGRNVAHSITVKEAMTGPQAATPQTPATQEESSGPAAGNTAEQTPAAAQPVTAPAATPPAAQ